MLCPPDAAISRPRLTCSWPLTSLKSISCSFSVSDFFEDGFLTSCTSIVMPLMCSTTLRKDEALYTEMSSTLAASRALFFGRIKVSHCDFKESAIGRAPRNGLSLPFNESSPQRMMLLSASCGSSPVAARIPMAIGKSKPTPSFFMSAGERFTVIFSKGNWKPEFFMADRIRSLLSLIAVSGRPTTENDGIPRVTSTSTSMGQASIPKIQPEFTFANI